MHVDDAPPNKEVHKRQCTRRQSRSPLHAWPSQCNDDSPECSKNAGKDRYIGWWTYEQDGRVTGMVAAVCQSDWCKCGCWMRIRNDDCWLGALFIQRKRDGERKMREWHAENKSLVVRTDVMTKWNG